MQIGLIAPTAHLNEFATGDFHLILSHILDKDPVYKEHYKKVAAIPGTRVVLDNSAFELGRGVDVIKLFEQAQDIGAHEIVLPDVMHDMYGTVDLTVDAMRRLADHKPSRYFIEEEQSMSVMLVPQGDTIYNWGLCLNKLLVAWRDLFGDTKYVIGVPKDYDNLFFGGRANLIQRYIEPMRQRFFLDDIKPETRFDVHALGVSSRLWQLGELSSRFHWIRSTDTVKPFTVAMAGIEAVRGYDAPTYNVKRPEDYFNMTLSKRELRYARTNVSVFRYWAASEVPVP